MKQCKENHNYDKELKKCPECAKANTKRWYQANKEQQKANMKVWYEANKEQRKICQKAYYEANKEQIKAAASTYYKINKEQVKTSMKSYYEANKEQYSSYYEANKEQVKAYYEANKEQIKANVKTYKQMNQAKYAAYARKREAARLHRTPPWLTQADLEKIERFYIEAKLREQATGIKYHVDHIVPLRGKNVSGLHVPWNLQLLEAKTNISKSNKFNKV